MLIVNEIDESILVRTGPDILRDITGQAGEFATQPCLLALHADSTHTLSHIVCK